jgi:hypothetical protein
MRRADGIASASTLLRRIAALARSRIVDGSTSREEDALMSFRVIRGTMLTVAFATAWLAAGAARSAGPVVGWGYNFDGQATPPPSVAGTATAIAAGGGRTLAIAALEPATALVSATSLGSLLALARRRRLG